MTHQGTIEHQKKMEHQEKMAHLEDPQYEVDECRREEEEVL